MQHAAPSKAATPNPETSALRWLTIEETGRALGFSRNTMSAILRAGAPSIAKKMNPELTQRWLAGHWARVGKIRP